LVTAAGWQKKSRGKKQSKMQMKLAMALTLSLVRGRESLLGSALNLFIIIVSVIIWPKCHLGRAKAATCRKMTKRSVRRQQEEPSQFATAAQITSSSKLMAGAD